MTSTIQNIASALPSLGRARLLINSADDVVIVSAVRTPITKVSNASSFTIALPLSSLCRMLESGETVGRMELTPRPRKEASKIVYLKTSSLLSSRRR